MSAASRGAAGSVVCMAAGASQRGATFRARLAQMQADMDAIFYEPQRGQAPAATGTGPTPSTTPARAAVSEEPTR